MPLPSSPTPNLSIASPRFPGAALRSRPSSGAGTPKKVATKGLKGHLSMDSLPQSIKFLSRRSPAPAPVSMPSQPATKKKVNKHWWDSFPLEEQDSDVESEHDPNLVTPKKTIFPPSSRGAPSPGRLDVTSDLGGRSDYAHGVRRRGSAQDIISARSSVTVRSVRNPASRESRSESRVTLDDPHQMSVLSMSSSSESESESEIDEDEHVPRHIRDSIVASDIDVHHVGQAQAVPLNTMRRTPQNVSADRRPSLASISSIITTTDSSSIQSGNQGLAYLSVPNRIRKSGHTRQPSSIPEGGDNSSQVASPASPPTSMRSFSAPQVDSRKLMAVTEEEEALLEMMRRKRADKAAQRDSGMASVASSARPRPFSNLSGSSSILDSFPISRSQRSSLLASRTVTQQLLTESSTEVQKTDRGYNRQSAATTGTDNTYYSIDSRLESPTRLKYAFNAHLSLATLDVSLAGLQPMNQDDASLPSPEPMDEPQTPFTRRGSADVIICDDLNKHNSIASYAYGDRGQAQADLIKERPEEKMRRKTTSDTLQYASSKPVSVERLVKVAERPSYTTASSDEETSPAMGTDDRSSTVSSKRASTMSKNTSECGSTCGHAGCSGNMTRCSVSEDVLDAWRGLGGWREGSGSTMA